MYFASISFSNLIRWFSSSVVVTLFMSAVAFALHHWP